MKTRADVKYFVYDCLWKQFFGSNSSQVPSNSMFFDNFDNSKVIFVNCWCLGNNERDNWVA